MIRKMLSMQTKYLAAKVGKRVTVRIPERLSPPFPEGTTEATGKLLKLRLKKKRAPRAQIDFGKNGTHEVRTADVLR